MAQITCLPAVRFDYYNYDAVMGWDTTSRHGYSYDVDGHVVDDTVYQYAGGGSYDPFLFLRYAYDGAGRTLMQTQHEYDVALASFSPGIRNEWTYDAFGNTVQRMELRWDDAVSAWDTFSIVQIRHTFDGNDSILTSISSEGTSLAGPFADYSLVRWVRDAQGRALEWVDSLHAIPHPWNKRVWSYPAPTGGYDTHELWRWGTSSSGWELQRRAYNMVWLDFAAGKLLSQDIFAPTVPVDSVRTQTEWLPDGSSISLTLKRNMGALDSLQRFSSYLDSYGNAVLGYVEAYASGWDTTYLDSTQYFRGPTGCLLERIHHDERPFGPGTFGPAERNVYVYKPVGVLPPAMPADFIVYPNPGKGQVTLQWEGSPRNVELVDALGRVMLQWDGLAPGTALDVGDMAPGIYFWRSGNAVTRWVCL